ncbi:MAG: HepT-like ribonuclease domain-containing protein [Thermosulfidibacteraceae bacterium]
MGERFRYAKGRIVDTIEFILKEIEDYKTFFGTVSYEDYVKCEDILKIKALEKTIENILTALIELSGTISIEERKKIENYYSALKTGATIVGLSEKETEDFAELAFERNNLVHRYLDLKWNAIKAFQEKLPLIVKFVKKTYEYYRKKNIDKGKHK